MTNFSAEKNLLTKKLKDEAEKNRDLLASKMRELNRLKRKQEKASDLARKLAFADRLGVRLLFS